VLWKDKVTECLRLRYSLSSKHLQVNINRFVHMRPPECLCYIIKGCTGFQLQLWQSGNLAKSCFGSSSSQRWVYKSVWPDMK